MEPITPAFRLTGLSSTRVYTLGFHASSSNSDSRRETRYLITGGSTSEQAALLDASGNTNGVAWVTGVVPDASSAVEVRLLSGPGNDSDGRISQLGVLALEWRTPDIPPPPTVRLLGAAEGRIRLRIDSAKGRACLVERSVDLVSWTEDGLVRPGAAGIELSRPTHEPWTFFRLVDAVETHR